MKVLQQQLDAMAAQSRNPMVRLLRPRLSKKKMSGNGISGFRDVVISESVYASAPKIQRYVMAHEVGHLEAMHGWIGFLAGLAALNPLILYSGSEVFRICHLPPFHYSLSFVSVMAAAIGWALVFFDQSMQVEYVADRYGARLIGKAAMLDGMRAIARKKGVPKRYYARKIRNLRKMK